MKYVKITLGVVLAIAMIVFAVQNIATVDVSFLTWSMTVPKVVLILGTYLLGMVSGWGLVEILKRTLKEKS